LQKDIYRIEIAEHVDKIFLKLKKKDTKQLEIINSKILQILMNPEHFKPLRGDLSGSRRVHIGKSFVLIYDFNKEDKIIKILDYGHRDKIY
jgi:YafQ family addiction module toxin component